MQVINLVMLYVLFRENMKCNLVFLVFILYFKNFRMNQSIILRSSRDVVPTIAISNVIMKLFDKK